MISPLKYPSKRRRRSDRYEKCGASPALKITKHRFTIAAVRITVQSGSLAANSGNTASCDGPAYAMNDMPSDYGTVSTDLLIAMPVTRPHDKVARTAGEKVRTPSK